MCIDQRGLLKCAKHTYSEKEQCTVRCPAYCVKNGANYECVAK